MAPPATFSAKSKTYALRVTVVGHASARWKGAKDRAEADRLNDALSRQRADAVRAAVEKVLKAQLPGMEISAGRSTADGKPNGLEVGGYGVGSREPVKKGGGDDDDSPVNRGVAVAIELVATEHGYTGRSNAPLRISARTPFWYLKVTSLSGGAVGGAAMFVRVVLRNSLSGKEASYSGYLFGGGVGVTVSRGNPGTMGKPIGDEVSFYTDDAMGFDDFDGQLVRIEKVEAALGIKSTVSYFNYISLGKGARELAFDKGIGLGKPSLVGFVASGRLKLEGKNPGDYYEVDGGTDMIPTTTDHKLNDGLVLIFPTEKANLSDLTEKDRKRLDDFATGWARLTKRLVTGY